MADGLWVMAEDGSFELQEPYKGYLKEARIVSTKAWTEALIGYLVDKCPYTAQELMDELVHRNSARDERKMMIFEEFVLEALSGDL